MDLVDTIPDVRYGAGGQNIEQPHTLANLSLFIFIFCFKCILVLLARRTSGELCCPATALIDSFYRIYL